MALEPGDFVADKYRISETLGEGGMGTVFSAINTMTGKTVALKWLLPEVEQSEEHVQRLLREAKAAALIDHPNVVNMYDVGRHEASIFLVMEYLHGEPLSRLLATGKQDPAAFIDLMMPALRGVHAAHRAGIVHRDLKPDNIFLCRDATGQPREPKVLDFGISVISGERLEGTTRLTRDGTLIGTPHYMAPEQVRDPKGVDPRTDVYALGVIYYEALSGGMPFDAVTLQALAIAIVDGDAEPLSRRCPELDPALCQVIMRAMSCDLNERFHGVDAFARALEPFGLGASFNSANREWKQIGEVTGSSPNHTPRSGGFDRDRQRRSRRRAVAAVAVLSVGLAVLALWLIDGMQKPDVAARSSEAEAPPDEPPVASAPVTGSRAPGDEPALAASPIPADRPGVSVPEAEAPAQPDGPDPSASSEKAASTEDEAERVEAAAREERAERRRARRTAQARAHREREVAAEPTAAEPAAAEPNPDPPTKAPATPSPSFETESNPYLRR